MPWSDARAGRELRQAENAEYVRALLEKLPPRLRRVVWLHHGEGRTLEEIGQEEGLTRERVRQLIGMALERLRLKAGGKNF